MENNPVIVYKYGGNAMVDKEIKQKVLENFLKVKDRGFDIVIAHGGGPFIKKALDDAKITSKFIGGHRVTTFEAFNHIEMILKGRVNSDLVNYINSTDHRAVGLSGRDGKTVVAKKRRHKSMVDGLEKEVDLGQVGDVRQVNTDLIHLLLGNAFIPVISCIAADEKGNGYNINGDMFAGHLAGAMKAAQFVVLTDVDGLLRDKDDPGSIIRSITLSEIEKLKLDGTIQGGMIPKIEACEIALHNGAKSAKIINGTVPDQLLSVEDKEVGTLIKK